MTDLHSIAGTRRSIYRADAVLRYGRGREKSVLPRFVCPGTMTWLWIFLGLLMVSGLLVCLVRLPRFSSGQGIFVKSTDLYAANSSNLVMVALLPHDILSSLHVGQKLFVNLGGKSERLSGSIIAVEPEVNSPEEVRKRFSLSRETALAATKPLAVAIAQVGRHSSDLSASSYDGSIYHVDVEIGSRRLISLLAP